MATRARLTPNQATALRYIAEHEPVAHGLIVAHLWRQHKSLSGHVWVTLTSLETRGYVAHRVGDLARPGHPEDRTWQLTRLGRHWVDTDPKAEAR